MWCIKELNFKGRIFWSVTVYVNLVCSIKIWSLVAQSLQSLGYDLNDEEICFRFLYIKRVFSCTLHTNRRGATQLLPSGFRHSIHEITEPEIEAEHSCVLLSMIRINGPIFQLKSSVTKKYRREHLCRTLLSVYENVVYNKNLQKLDRDEYCITPN